jgi:hypothetical protein
MPYRFILWMDTVRTGYISLQFLKRIEVTFEGPVAILDFDSSHGEQSLPFTKIEFH